MVIEAQLIVVNVPDTLQARVITKANIPQLAIVEVYFVIIQCVDCDLTINPFAWSKITNHDSVVRIFQ